MKMRTENLRQWASPSYDPATGKEASKLGGSGAYSAEGFRVSPSRQLPKGQPGKGSPSWSEIDKARCNLGTKVTDRPIG